MKTFYACYNNGVNALVPEAVLADMAKVSGIRSALHNSDYRFPNRDIDGAVTKGLSHIKVGPIFTFTYEERVTKSPWFTANTEFLNDILNYLAWEGHTVLNAEFYVPFSNARETGVHGDDAMTSELAYVTTSKDFIDAFGVSIEELKKKVAEKAR